MLKVSLWGNKSDIQTEMAHWCLDVIDGKYRVFSTTTTTTTTVEENSIISAKLLEVITLLENIEIILKNFPKGLKCKAYFLCNTSQCKVIKLNLKNKAFLVGDSKHYNLNELLQAHNDIIMLGKNKFYLMNDFFKYLKTFLPDMSAEAYLVIQGDIYDIPKYMAQKVTEGVLSNLFAEPRTLTSQTDNSNIQSPSKYVNSIFS